MGKAAVLHIMRKTDGTLVNVGGDLPKEMTFSSRYVSNGGNAARADHRLLMSQAKEAEDKGHTKVASDLYEQAGKLNLEPLFLLDGQDIIFPFEDGAARYRFIGFEVTDGGELNTGAMRYQLVED